MLPLVHHKINVQKHYELHLQELDYIRDHLGDPNNYDLKWVAEPGDFEVMIGTNSEQVNKAGFKLLK